MKNSRKYIDLINEKLLMKRNSDDISISLNIPEHKFKKHAAKLNWALWEIFESNKDHGTKLFHLILCMQDYFDISWLTENVLDDKSKKQIESEMSIEYGISKKKSKKTQPKKKIDSIEI